MVNRQTHKKVFLDGEIPPDSKTSCECGYQLDFILSPYETQSKRICPRCGKLNFVEEAPIDWGKAGAEALWK